MAAAPGLLRMRVRDRTLDLSGTPTIKEKMAVRFATGLPYEAFVADERSLGEDSFAVLWWLARRQNGEPQLSFDQAASEWPNDLTPDDVACEAITPDEEPENDHPE
jgi:hypothetical protein